jgi:hypothetical protein
MPNRYDIEAVLYNAAVRGVRDVTDPDQACRVAVTEERNGFAIWIALTCPEDSPEERSYSWFFSALYDTREEAIERAVKRVEQEKGGPASHLHAVA